MDDFFKKDSTNMEYKLDYSFDYESKPWYDKGSHGWYVVLELLCQHIVYEHHIFAYGSKFFQYKNGYYAEIGKNIVTGLIKKHTDNRIKPDTIDKVVRLIVHEDKYKIIEFNGYTNIINTKNCMIKVDINDIKSYKYDKNFYSTIRINANYKKTKEYNCPIWLKFLSQITKEENIKIIQEMFGYTLIPEIKGQTSFIFYGKGGSGKSTVLQILQTLIGEDNYSNIPFQDLGKRFNKVLLRNKLANICGDLPSSGIESTDTFKMIVGGDKILAENKGKDGIFFVNKARCIFSCNEIPISYNDVTDGYFRRLKLIPCLPALTESEKGWFRDEDDPVYMTLYEKLLTEINDIFLWSIEGLQRLMSNGYIVSSTKSSNDLMSSYKRSCSAILSYIDEYCILDEEKTINAKQLYNHYKITIIDEGGKPMKYSKFTERLEQNGVMKTRQNNERIYKGITLADSEHFDKLDI